MIPKIISDSASSAEKKVFYELEKLDDNYIVFHSLNLPEHLDKVKGEIDFTSLTKDEEGKDDGVTWFKIIRQIDGEG